MSANTSRVFVKGFAKDTTSVEAVRVGNNDKGGGLQQGIVIKIGDPL